MKLKLGVGTGTFYNKAKYDINRAIGEINLLGMEFIEITFGSLKSFENLVLTKENLRLLKKFKLVTIHAPCIPYEKNQQTKKLLLKLNDLYNLVNAKYITFHPHYFEDFSILLDYDWQICIENSRPGKNWNYHKLKKLFEKYPRFGLVLDTAHASEFSREEINLLFSKFKNKIKYFHISACYKEKPHQPLHTIDKKYLIQFDKIINFGKPLLVEVYGGLVATKKEIEFLKEKFG